MPPFRRRRMATRRSHRKTQWVDFKVDFAALPIGDFTNIDLMQTYRAMPGASSTGVTMLRHHLYVWVTSAVVTGDGIAVGVAVDDQAEAIGATALGSAHAWNPQDQPYLAWTVYRRFNAHPGYDFHGGNSANLEFDVRSKRRIPFGDTVLLSLLNIDASAAVSWSVHSRILIGLP